MGVRRRGVRAGRGGRIFDFADRNRWSGWDVNGTGRGRRESD